MKLRDHVWAILNDEKDPRQRAFGIFINTLIFLSVGLLVVETFRKDLDPARYELLRLVDHAILGIFTLEYLARLWVIKGWRPKMIKLSRMQLIKYWIISRIKYMLSPWGLIDLLALLPLVPFLRSLRVLRLLRLFRSVKLFRYSNPLTTLMAAFRENALLFGVASGFVLVCIVVSAAMFFFAEYGSNPNVKSISDTLWWSIVTITTVGFGDITPTTLGGRVVGAALMIAGMFVVAVFAGVISSTLVGHLMPLQQEQIRMSTLSGHLIVAGWNDNVPMLLEQLKAEKVQDPPTVLIFAPINRPEILPPEYTFVHGDFTKESEYEKVRLKFASTILVVADTAGGAMRSAARDASTVLTVFTIRRVERLFAQERTAPLHICAEILDPENIDHATTAGADEVLATALIGNSIMAHMASNPGVGGVMTNLLLATRNNIYTSPMPIGLMDGQTLPFRELQDKTRAKYGVLVLGLSRHGQLHLNPDPEFATLLNDDLVYLGDKMIVAPKRG